MTKSRTREEDTQREKVSKGKVETAHGGEIVEAIAPEELELMNEPDCPHENLTRDESETEFNAFICDNPKCGVVAMFDKT